MLSIVLMTTALAGCSAGTFKTEITLGHKCPPIPAYPKEFQKQAADELKKLPPNSPTNRLVTDYSRFRDACKAIDKVK